MSHGVLLPKVWFGVKLKCMAVGVTKFYNGCLLEVCILINDLIKVLLYRSIADWLLLMYGKPCAISTPSHFNIFVDSACSVKSAESAWTLCGNPLLAKQINSKHLQISWS
jgi:hypothetical protein